MRLRISFSRESWPVDSIFYAAGDSTHLDNTKKYKKNKKKKNISSGKFF